MNAVHYASPHFTWKTDSDLTLILPSWSSVQRNLFAMAAFTFRVTSPGSLACQTRCHFTACFNLHIISTLRWAAQ